MKGVCENVQSCHARTMPFATAREFLPRPRMRCWAYGMSKAEPCVAFWATDAQGRLYQRCDTHPTLNNDFPKNRIVKEWKLEELIYDWGVQDFDTNVSITWDLSVVQEWYTTMSTDLSS